MIHPQLIRLAGVNVSRGGKILLNNLDWELKPGCHWALLGPNGAGKSTFLRLLRGEIRSDQNSGGICEWAFTGVPDPSPLAVRGISALVSPALHGLYVRQAWKLSLEELLLSGLSDAFLPYSAPTEQELDAARQIARALKLDGLLKSEVPVLSQGQLRLALLGRALISKPTLLLLDEAADSLDAQARKLFFKALHSALDWGASLICTGHRQADLPDFLTHCLHLEQGSITHSGPFVPQKASLKTLQRKATTDKIVQPEHGPPLLELRNVDVYIERKQVLHGLDWQVNLGESWLISGSNGAGKSTLLRLIAGDEIAAWGGELLWFGQSELPPLEERRKFIGQVSDLMQNTYGYDLTGRELVVSGLRGHIGLYEPPAPPEVERASQVIRQLNLSAHADVNLSKLSFGLARRFMLARALAPKPRLLLLDEPCSGLDAQSRELFLKALPEIAGQGIQIIFISHNTDDLSLLHGLFTHSLTLEQGKISKTEILK